MSTSTLRDFVSKSRNFRVPRDRVFHAWTTEKELIAWWRPGHYRAESVRIDLRVGGTYEILMVDREGTRQRLSGIYREIVAPERLVMTWRLEGSPADDGYEALLTLTFHEAPGGTVLQLTHERLRWAGIRAFDAGWEGLLPKLASHLEGAELS
jgi:glutathione S-transferase